ncbi:MAG: nucleotide exchange factor GrpE [Chloroflexaceae bacterium]|jgi:molecular chaperone GrpE|nr:nucleotide exchange factor GrpE [Chloroflexaceae bacterium]
MSDDVTKETVDNQASTTTTEEPSDNGSFSHAELLEKLAQAESQAADYKDQWLRAAADYKNYKRRTETERAELLRSASGGVILKLLPVLDDFERAIANIPPEVAETPWWGGTQLIAQKLRTILESEGVTPIAALDADFDPNLHEAVIYEDAPGQEGKVVAELQKGYKLRDRVLRPTMVKVGKG